MRCNVRFDIFGCLFTSKLYRRHIWHIPALFIYYIYIYIRFTGSVVNVSTIYSTRPVSKSVTHTYQINNIGIHRNALV